ncbi:rCG30428, isoform CRA_b [Rattus norvegicus]|uniref:RCG30428, isoform CRA_b n=1 Tax=Rattus norvegicus TaxID=10116 RepID=A6JFR5_RAT|nr:rCG30428, isoform CRA_b [Rattus norvegicus]
MKPLFFYFGEYITSYCALYGVKNGYSLDDPQSRFSWCQRGH